MKTITVIILKLSRATAAIILYIISQEMTTYDKNSSYHGQRRVLQLVYIIKVTVCVCVCPV